MKKIYLLIAFFAAAGLCAQPLDQVWTLEAAVDHAVANNLLVRNAALDADQSDALLRQSKFNLLPTVNGNIDNTWNFGRSIDQTTNTFINRQLRNNNIAIGANMVLFNGFANRTTVKVQQQAYLASVADVETARNDTKLSVAAAYLNILLARELLTRAEAQVDNSRQQADRTRRLVTAGAAPEANLLELESQQATDELQVINAGNQLDLARLQLQQLLQLPVRDAFEVVVPDLDGLIDTNRVVLSLPERVYQEALTSQPQILAADLRVQGSLLNVQASRGRLYPRLSASANAFTRYSSASELFQRVGGGTEVRDISVFDTSGAVFTLPGAFLSDIIDPQRFTRVNYPFFDQLQDNVSYSVGFSLIVPILNGWTARTTVATATIAARRAQLNAIDARNRLRQNIEQAYTDARAAANRYAASQRQVRALGENARLAEQRFNVGALNALDYSLSRNNLLTAESSLLESKYDFIFKKKVLEFYEGKPLTLQ